MKHVLTLFEYIFVERIRRSSKGIQIRRMTRYLSVFQIVQCRVKTMSGLQTLHVSEYLQRRRGGHGVVGRAIERYGVPPGNRVLRHGGCWSVRRVLVRAWQEVPANKDKSRFQSIVDAAHLCLCTKRARMVVDVENACSSLNGVDASC